jgi:YbdK family carboxylate-amine ligase
VGIGSPPFDGFGATFGIEEEYHLVDAHSLTLRRIPALAQRALRGKAGPRLHSEMLTSQLEGVTEVCTNLDLARSAIAAMRVDAAAAAGTEGAAILATSTHPTAALEDVELVHRDRYDRLVERFGAVVRAFNLCGCHVHVSVPDLDAAVAVMAHARQYLPLLSTLTASSPFHEGVDTGYQSFRIAWLSLWQQGGPPPHLQSGEEYLAVVEQLTTTGLVEEASELLWELRPSSRYPTLEFRVADVCPDIDDVVMFAGLVRALVATLGARERAGIKPPTVSDAALRAARWRAARYGLGGEVWDPTTGRLVPSPDALESLIEEVAPALRYFGDEATVCELAAKLVSRGTSAHRQREQFAVTGDLHEVLSDAVRVTADV